MATAAVAGLLAACGASLNSGPEIADGFPKTDDPAMGVAAGTGASEMTAKAKMQAGVAPKSGDARSLARMADSVTATGMPSHTSYKIGPYDVLDISVFQVPELSRSAQVSDNGTVTLALLGEYPVAGRTLQDVERDLTRRLGAKYLQNPQVTVSVKEFNSQRVTIEGAVKKSGVHPLRGRTSLLQAIAMADGLDATADTNIVIFRQTAQGRLGARFDLAEIRAGRAEDPPLASGDVIVVGTSFWKEQYSNFTKLLPLMGVFALL